MTISHVHCRVKDLLVAVEWFTSKCGVVPSFSDARMAVLAFGPFTVILDAASDDTVATIGFNSPIATSTSPRWSRAAREWCSRRRIVPTAHASPICRGLARSPSSSNSCSHPPNDGIRKLDRSRHVGNVNFSFADHTAATGGPP